MTDDNLATTESEPRIKQGDFVVRDPKKPVRRRHYIGSRSRPITEEIDPAQRGLVLEVDFLNGRAKAKVFWQLSQNFEFIYTTELINIRDLKDPEAKRSRGRPRKKAK